MSSQGNDEHNTDDDFKSAVKALMQVYQMLDEQAQATKDLKTKKTELSKAILSYMQRNNIDECQVGTGKLCRSVQKRHGVLNKTFLVGELTHILKDSEQANSVVQSIMDNRTVTEIEQLKRKKI
jgi:hypothetical protein